MFKSREFDFIAWFRHILPEIWLIAPGFSSVQKDKIFIQQMGRFEMLLSGHWIDFSFESNPSQREYSIESAGNNLVNEFLS